MTTKEEMIQLLKAEYPTLQTGSDEQGYTQLSADDYETTISEWADARLKKEAQIAAELAEAKAVKQAKEDAIAKLTALGIDPKALGL
jgi:hypothetical protein